jgi:hypothetical protein
MYRRPWVLFLFLILMQVSVFNRIHWLGLFNPMVYAIVLLWLPLSWNRAVSMLLGFGLGWWIDSSFQSGGIHAMASVWLVFIKPFWVKFTVPSVQLHDNPDPDLRDIEIRSLITYAGGLLLMHHIILYSLEALRWTSVPSSILKASINTLLVSGILWALIQWTRSLDPRKLQENRY